LDDVLGSSPEQIGVILASALTHRRFDTAAIDTAFQAQLRQKGIVLRQFGFSYLDEALPPTAPGPIKQERASMLPALINIGHDTAQASGAQRRFFNFQKRAACRPA
jgi:hypothetical protein